MGAKWDAAVASQLPQLGMVSWYVDAMQGSIDITVLLHAGRLRPGTPVHGVVPIPDRFLLCEPFEPVINSNRHHLNSGGAPGLVAFEMMHSFTDAKASYYREDFGTSLRSAKGTWFEAENPDNFVLTIFNLKSFGLQLLGPAKV